MIPIQQLFKQAQELHQQKKWVDAEQLYRHILLAAPHMAEAAHLLGIVLSQQENHQEGAQWIEKAIDLQPLQPHYYVNLGRIYAAMRQWDMAIRTQKVAIKFTPRYADPWFNLGVARKGKGDISGAIKAYKKVLALEPNYATAWYNLGNIYQETGSMKSALEAYQQCVWLQPQNPMAINNLGSVLEYWERWEEAEAHYQKALSLQPELREALRNIVGYYEKQGKVAEAKHYTEKLMTARPEDPYTPWVAWHLTQMSEIIWKDTAAIKPYRQSLKLQIEHFTKTPPPLVLSEIHQLHLQPPFDLAYQGSDDLPLKVAYGQFFENYFQKIRPQIHPQGQRQLRSHHKRVGFVVTQGHEGVFIKCMKGIIKHLNKAVLDVYIVCNMPNGEAILRPALEVPKLHYLSLSRSLDQAIRQLRQAELDILYYWEVGTDALNYFLPFCQLAPVQCTGWGWPVTSGIPAMDYFISCSLLELPGSHLHYSERLIPFKKLPTFYYQPPVPEDLQTKAELGFSEDDNLYFCAQNLRKVHPDMDEVFLKILTQDPKGIIVFIHDKQSFITKKLAARLHKKCDSYFKRIRFLARMAESDYLRLVALSDVILDTFYYTGGANTAYDAIAAGTPYVTLPRTFHRSRYGAAAYMQLGMIDLIAHDTADYIEKAVSVATNPEYRAHLKKRILQRRNHIFEDIEAVRELEIFFLNVTTSLKS